MDTSSSLTTGIKVKRSTSSRLNLLLFIFFLIALIIALLLMTYILIDKYQEKDKVCITEHCVKIAAKMIQSLNKSMDPCEDFYEFSCGSWIKNNPILENEVATTTFKKLNDVMILNLRVILETPVANNTDPDELTMKTLYASCQNMEKINELDKKPMERLLASFGSCPMLDPNWKEEDFNLTAVFIKLKFILSTVFKLRVRVDENDSNRRCIEMEQGLISSLKAQHTDPQFNRTRQAYKKLLFDLVYLMNPTTSNQTLEKEIQEVLEFDKVLTNITMKEELKRRIRNSNITTLNNLDQLFAGVFDFKHYVNTIFHPLKIDPYENITVTTPDYIEKLPSILKNTPSRVLANFLSSHVIVSSVELMSQRFLNLKQAYNEVYKGTQTDATRWVSCVTFTNDKMGNTLGRMYVRKHFDGNSKERALEMIQDIKHAFLQIVEEARWMEEGTKKVAKEKVLAMKEHIGYPDYIFNVSYVAEEFKDLHFSKDSYFHNVVQFRETMEKQNLLSLREHIDRDRWGTHPSQINAFYSSNMNQLTFPAGILQFPLYHGESPMSLNFGGIGMVIGHEITHGFDDKGSAYDKNGNLKTWWPPNDRKKFLNLTSCIVKQYGNYKIHGIQLNGNLTQGENIADNGGLKQAFRAYQNWVRKHGSEATLPGLSYNNQQLFYIKFGQIWCGSIRPELALQNAKLSKHSPGRYRVLGPLVNSKTFSQVFNCPIGSRMNPAHKCSVW